MFIKKRSRYDIFSHLVSQERTIERIVAKNSHLSNVNISLYYFVGFEYSFCRNEERRVRTDVSARDSQRRTCARGRALGG